MADPVPTVHRCPQCGKEYPTDTLVCADCRVILQQPEVKPRTPGWVIALLVAAIVVVLAYAAVLSYRIFVLHQY